MKKSKIESHNGIKILLNSNTYLSSWRGIKLNDTYKNLQFDFKKNNPIVNRIGMGLTCLTRFSPLFVCTSLGGIHKLRLQDEVGRWSKNIYFLSTFIL